MIKFIVVFAAGVVGNGLGAWNIRTISSGRYWATAGLTFAASLINVGALRTVIRDVSGIYVLAWALGSTLGIVGAVILDRRFFHKDFTD